MRRLLPVLFLGAVLLWVAAPARAQAPGERANELTSPGRVVSERPDRAGAPPRARPRPAPFRVGRSRPAVVRAAWVGALGTSLVLGGTALGFGLRSARECDPETSFNDCGRAALRRGMLAYGLSAPIALPLVTWGAGRAAGGRGKLGLSWATTLGFLLLGGLVGAIGTSVADSDAGLGVSLGVASLLPGVGTALGTIASDAERRR